MEVNKKRLCVYLISFLLIVLIVVSTLSAQISIINSKEVESEILGKLSKESKISVIVKLHVKDDKIRDLVISGLSTSDFRLKEKLLGKDGFAGDITKGGFDKLINNPNVRAIYLDRIIQVHLTESLPLINATSVWAEGYTGKDQTVCVIDSGINWTHPDLGGCKGTNCKVLDGYDFVYNDNDPMDDTGHGTHVAGIVASKGKINGTAPDAKLIAMKVCNTSGCFTPAIMNSIEWCIANRTIYNISVISISLGNNESYTEASCPPTLRDEINHAYAVNISVFISSGNNNHTDGISWPACRGNATSVGAVYDEDVGAKSWCTQKNASGNCIEFCRDITTFADKIVCLTNRGNNLDLLAPGSVINSTDIDEDYSKKSGTSMACPHASGVATILLERDPTLTPDQIRDILNKTGESIWDPESQRSYPRIDVLAAFNSLCTCTSWASGSCGAGDCLDSEMSYSRTCTPSACDDESKCEFDTSCGGPGEDITVCANGCNYTVIQDAIDSSGPTDKVYITDSATYEEKLIMNSTTTEWLICQAGAKIYSTTGGNGIYINDVDAPTIIGCVIEGFSNGIYLANSSYGLIQNNTLYDNSVSIYIEDESVDNKISGNNITNSGDYGIKLKGSYWSAAIVSYNKIKKNIIKNNIVKGIWMDYGLHNTIEDNNISGSTDPDGYGIHIDTNNQNAFSTFKDNFIYKNPTGIYIYYSHQNTINTNTFCPSNSNVDINIDASTGTSGDNNRCEKPGTWNDTGTTGCTYYCDTPAEVTLLYPPNNFVDIDGDVELTCQSTDNYKLVNVTLYHNISGTWHANQTKNISGVSNITTFSINDIADGTVFIWNCLAYDNKSRGSFADANWTVNVSIPPDNPPNVTLISPSDNSVDEDGSVTFNCSATDDDNLVNITLYGNWTGNWHANETKSLSGTSNSTTFTKSLSDGIYKWNCLAFDDASQSDWADTNWTINVSIVLPDDPHKTYHRDAAGNTVAWLGNQGNIVLKGSCYSGGNCDNPGPDSFIFRNLSDDNVAFINSTGDLCVVTGDCSDQSATCNTNPENAFIVKNASDDNVIYIDKYGDLCLIGGLYENYL